MATSLPSSAAATLLNASVLVFLLRALAGARVAEQRAQVSAQLLRLIADFVPFQSGVILVGRSVEDVEAQFVDGAMVWERLVADGPVEMDGLVAVPFYAHGALAGALVLRGAGAGPMPVLSAIASLATAALESAREVERLREDVAALEGKLRGNGGILGHSAAIGKLLERIEKVAPRETTVLIQGESGTGKELVARLLHRGSGRAEGPFAAINCAAISESLLESELFGHEKGAFTGAVAQTKGKLEAAAGGTLFLDEVGELALPLQAKLLRVLQEREFERVGSTRAIKVDLRIIAATNRELTAPGFRLDLYHRLNVVTLRTPALRERREDIAKLAAHFLEQFGEQCNRRELRLSPEALRCLEAHDWPGNVRELENAIEHAVVLGEGNVVQPSDLPESVVEAAPIEALGEFQASVSGAKRESILRAYQQAGGDYKGASKLLGLHPNYLLRLVRNLGLKEAIQKQA